jgi:hypothetical protein
VPQPLGCLLVHLDALVDVAGIGSVVARCQFHRAAVVLVAPAQPARASNQSGAFLGTGPEFPLDAARRLGSRLNPGHQRHLIAESLLAPGQEQWKVVAQER